jgi:hypothetical protein
MQSEVAQLRLAGHDRFRRPPHIEDHQAGEQREAGDRDGDERQHAAHDLAARPGLRPRQARYGVPLRVGDVRDLLPVGLCRIVDLAQARQLQPVADVAQHVLVDIFDGKHDGARSLPSARSASVPTATAATIAGRPANCWMSAVRRPGLRGFWARTAMVRLGIAASRPRSRSRLGASCVRKSATAGSPGERKSLYLI